MNKFGRGIGSVRKFKDVHFHEYIVTGHQQSQTQQQNNQHYIWAKYSLGNHHHHTDSKLHERAEIEQYLENKSYWSI